MNYLLDTCIISELVKPEPNNNVLDWIHNTPTERLYLSVITIGEIRKGLTKLPDSKRQDLLTNYKEAVGLLYKWLNRRSQRRSLTWDSLKRVLVYYAFPTTS